MIKLERGECPKELTKELIEELMNIYKLDKGKDVWNSPKIKKPLKDALTNMSNNKCAYCECMLNIETKDVTIDHFSPKVSNEILVLEWTNLLPSCLRCNRTKNSNEVEIINPCEIDPKIHLGIKNNGFRLKEINNSIIGKNTIRVLRLNDIDRVVTARMIITEKIIEKLNEVLEDIEDTDIIKSKYINRIEGYLSEALRDRPYCAVASAKILDDRGFKTLKLLCEEKGKWNDRLQKIENELIILALPIE
ncbi:HNH endonuclease [Clostridium gasigenes]|uniref:HNH endonuclease n=1 Tax=Clostridium gasigenes TaxID=94869 RepID=UPI001C0E1E50|nr:HNH endonuclease [Clostridium gasigenes]MBU3133367.1 HNH endonuclease [Clostridium gasigenes]